MGGKFEILLEEMRILVYLNKGRFPANAFYILKKGDPQKRMVREEILQALAKINEKISQI